MLPPEQRRTFYLYVDEFQAMATDNFVVMLSEARKFGIALILANQFLSQIQDQRIIQAIFGNVGTLISFRVSQEDAKYYLEPHLKPTISTYDLTNLPNWQAIVKTTVNGQVVPPFSLHTVLPNQPVNKETAARIRNYSRNIYGRPREMVEKEIEDSLFYDEPDESLFD